MMAAKKRSAADVTRDVVVIGGSMGAIEALSQLVRALPARFPAAVFVVQHVAAYHNSVLPDILSRAGPLTAKHAVDGETYRRGHIYVAPPNHHLLIEGTKVRVIVGPRENGQRPAVNPLFRSAAFHAGPRVIGVVLSGSLDCGAAGVRQIKLQGGLSIIQDPETALTPDMPTNAAHAVEPDFVGSPAEIAKELVKLTRVKIPGGWHPPSKNLARSLRASTLDKDRMKHPQDDGRKSPYGCPACGGVLYDVVEATDEFRCRTGHTYSGEALQQEQDFAIESAIYTALRALEDRGTLLRRLSQRAQDAGHRNTAERYSEELRSVEANAEAVRRLLKEQE